METVRQYWEKLVEPFGLTNALKKEHRIQNKIC